MTAFRFSRLAALAAMMVLALSGCATRHPVGQLPFAPVSAEIVWRVEAGDVIKTRVYREPDLTGETAVGTNGTAYFPGLGRVNVAGLTVDSLQAEVAGRYGKLILDAAVEVTLLRDVVVYGEARTPGVYAVDPSVTMLGLLAKGGGAIGAGKNVNMTMVKADGRQLRLPREARLSQIDFRHGDAVHVAQDSFLARNVGNLTVFSTVVAVLVSITSIISLSSR